MQRILEPGEIQSLDATALPRVRLPQRADVFAARARRLRELAGGNAIGGYLRLMAILVDAQQQVLSGLDEPVFDVASTLLAQRHGMPIVPAVAPSLRPEWRTVLGELVERVATQVAAADKLAASAEIATGTPAGTSSAPTKTAAAAATPPSFIALLARLRDTSTAELDAQASALLERQLDEIDAGTAPLIYAALQIVWTQRACALANEDMPYLDAPGLCPVCGSPPIASIVRVGGAYDGYRYLECTLCATQTHFVRVKCSHCASTKGIAYQSIEGSFEGTRAESCEECHCYRKIFAQNKLFDAEPFVDDLASLSLDLMMNEAGYHRPNPHPFLWPARDEGEHA
ncbi:formate dehydrogenase accessory protein FdhE [Pararobbsia alpina]|uniref:Protein FdhE homolog n=1 Tax=Pararobbsia alpina TaxID=621374 RepID=A0A6S7BAW3_9BURK|nr:formate dehydrogenase accessory protein FdhE [Pararobbsia alpina]CAB3782886.1 Protein FdhE [Pararobbsia alpina]